MPPRTGRPDPDALLARLTEDEAKARRGRLKIFLGAAPGVGKTYTMLEAARARRAERFEVVVGIVETHGRAETERLLEGLEVLPRRAVEYRGVMLREFDLDAALARRPRIILVDELAHTNAPGLRHAKRWQDVRELLAAGIDVYTTMNIQHVESLNDVVAQITGVVVRETVPDEMLDSADEVELADVTADVLLERLREGKVYVADQAAKAVEGFFRRGNLIALRELALRRTADRVGDQMRGYMVESGITTTWPAAERVMVCVGASPASARIIRAGRRIAASLQAEWFAVYVETPDHHRRAPAEQEAVTANFTLAERLGGEAVRLSGLNVGEEVLAWALGNNVTRIVVGKPTRRHWRGLVRASLHEKLIRESGPIDVHVVRGDPVEGPGPRIERYPPMRAGRADYGWAALVVLVATGVSFLMRPWLPTANIAMVFLLAVVIAAARYGRGPAIAACLVSIAVFDFFFVPPYYTFAVSDRAYIPTFGIMLAVALLMSHVTHQVREQAEAARERERRTAALYDLARDLTALRAPADLAAIAARRVQFTVRSGVTFLLPDDGGRLVPADPSAAASLDEHEASVARWSFDHAEPAGLGTGTLPAARDLWLPLVSSGRTVGVMGVRPQDQARFRDPAERQLLEAFAGLAAVAMERALLARRTEEAHAEIEAERLRTALLSSLSHDLRTPIAGIQRAASTLLDSGDAFDAEARRGLLSTVVEDAIRMDRLIRNLLDMVKLESGMLEPHRELQPLEEVVGIALLRLEPQLRGREVRAHLPADLPLVPIDGLLIEQVLINLLENALKYTPAGTPIDLEAEATDAAVVVEVADRGPGIPRGEEEHIFGKFARLGSPSGAGGAVGLGLTISRGIVAAHGGRIWVEPRPGGGARFRFSLPLGGSPPSTPLAAAEPKPVEALSRPAPKGG